MEDLLPGYKTLEEFTKDGFRSLMEGIKSSNALPSNRNYDYYTVHESFNNTVSDAGKDIMKLMSKLLKSMDLDQNIQNRALDEKIEVLIEANDNILERVANNIDEMNGIKKNSQTSVEYQTVSANLPINGSWNKLNEAKFSVVSSSNINVAAEQVQSIRLLTAKNILRPQMFFKDKIDNSNSRPWMPRIKDKPNSLKPLAIFEEENEGVDVFTHPYEFELDRFEPPVHQLKVTVPVFPKSLEETPLHEISTEDQLSDLIDELRNHTEFAVDLEHHSYRSFMGITCLMQISTRDADYLVDTLSLRDKLHMLNEVFTKPSILKIFHGADSDIQWLQRDLSTYVVNMFDTHQAARQLEYSGLSLAYLLDRFCQVTPNKHFQLADWRIRPLPDELKTYARMDTHYLLYVYHVLKNELLKKGNGSTNVLKSVFNRSTEICKKVYMKPLLTGESHMDLYRKCKRLFNNRQLFALKDLYQWRDNVARNEDESTGYVLPNHMMLQVAESLPREMQGILACCNPIPPLVRSNLLELHRIILLAREQSLEKPILKEDNRSRGSTLKFTKINIDSPLHCPHDLSKTAHLQENLPTLLNSDLTSPLLVLDKRIKIEKDRSLHSVFNEDHNFNIVDVKVECPVKFLGPYERYKLIKPYIEEEERKAAEAKESTTVKVEVGPTDEERIAALQEHVAKVLNETPQKPEMGKPSQEIRFRPNRSLMEMGGSKKRKREQEDSSNSQQENTLQTPVPNTTPQSKKRRSDEDKPAVNQKKKQKNKKWQQKNLNFQNPQGSSQYAQVKNKSPQTFQDLQKAYQNGAQENPSDYAQESNVNCSPQKRKPKGNNFGQKKKFKGPNNPSNLEHPQETNVNPNAQKRNIRKKKFKEANNPATLENPQAANVKPGAQKRIRKKKLKGANNPSTLEHPQVVNVNPNAQKRIRKKKLKGANNPSTLEHSQVVNVNPNAQKRIRKKKLKGASNPSSLEHPQAANVNPNVQKLNMRKKKFKGPNDSQVANVNKNLQQPNAQANNPGQKKKSKGGKNKFAAYDYSNTDFQQFQGGGSSVGQPQNMQSKFKAKGKNKWANKKSNNHSMTFATDKRF